MNTLLAAYAISEYENAPRSLPQRMVKWIEDLFAAIRMAVARAFPNSKIAQTFFENMGAADFAAIARRMMTDTSRVSSEGVEPMFSKVKKKKVEPPLSVEQAQKHWEREIARAEGAKETTFTLNLKVPQVLSAIGARLNKLEVFGKDVLHVIRNHPDVPKRVLEKLPTLISHPLYAFEHTQNQSWNLILSEKTRAGEYIMATFHEDGQLGTITPLHNDTQTTSEEKLATRLNHALSKTNFVYAKNGLPEEVGKLGGGIGAEPSSRGSFLSEPLDRPGASSDLSRFRGPPVFKVKILTEADTLSRGCIPVKLPRRLHRTGQRRGQGAARRAQAAARRASQYRVPLRIA